MLNDFIAELREIRDKREVLAAEDKKLKDRKAYVEEKVIEGLRAAGIDKASSDFGTVSITQTVHPQVEDWDKFMASGHPELLKKSLKSLQYRELLDMGIEIPGITPFTKETVSFRRK